MLTVAETENKGKDSEKMKGLMLIAWIGWLVHFLKVEWIILMVWKTFQVSRYPLKVILSS